MKLGDEMRTDKETTRSTGRGEGYKKRKQRGNKERDKWGDIGQKEGSKGGLHKEKRHAEKNQTQKARKGKEKETKRGK